MKKIALVVGNNLYHNLAKESQLQTAVSDARLMRDTFSSLGYSVYFGENLGRSDFLGIFSEFEENIEEEDLVTFFFAGHGVGIAGGNYFLPSDIQMPGTNDDGRVKRGAVAEYEMLFDIHVKRPKFTFGIFDACRNNPFRRETLRSVGTSKGLVSQPHLPSGTFNLYSARSGQTALDRLSETDNNPNSVFTRILAPELRFGRHSTLTDLAVTVRKKVVALANTVGFEQVPAYYDETKGGLISLHSIFDLQDLVAGASAYEAGDAKPHVEATYNGKDANILSLDGVSDFKISQSFPESIAADFIEFKSFVVSASSSIAQRHGVTFKIDLNNLREIHINWSTERQRLLNDSLQTVQVLGLKRDLAILLNELCKTNWIREIARPATLGQIHGHEDKGDVAWIIDGREQYVSWLICSNVITAFENLRIDRATEFTNRITRNFEWDMVFYLKCAERTALGIFMIFQAMYL